MAAGDSTKVADLLTQAANSGTIGIHELGETFKYIAPVAGAMGLSIEDVTTAVSAMSMAGIKGSHAGTALRTMLTRLVKPNDQVALAMEKLGIEVANQDGTMKSLDEIVAILRNSFSGLTDEERAMYAATLAGQEGMSGMLALLNLTEEADAFILTKKICAKLFLILEKTLYVRFVLTIHDSESLLVTILKQVLAFVVKKHVE